jgi:hypothetical protein
MNSIFTIGRQCIFVLRDIEVRVDLHMYVTDLTDYIWRKILQDLLDRDPNTCVILDRYGCQEKKSHNSNLFGFGVKSRLS